MELREKEWVSERSKFNLPNLTESISCDWMAKLRSSLRETSESPILIKPNKIKHVNFIYVYL